MLESRGLWFDVFESSGLWYADMFESSGLW